MKAGRNHKRVERIWRREGLRVPQKQPKRRRLWFNEGSLIRLRPEKKDHVWSYDFVFDRTSDGRSIKMLNIVDEYTRECLAIKVEGWKTAKESGRTGMPCCLLVRRDIPDHLRSDNGAEFTAHAVRGWLKRLGIKTLYIEPGSLWENGYIESFNGKLRDELLNGKVLDTLLEARILTEYWRQKYNQIRPPSSLGYRPPAPETIVRQQVING